MNPPNIISDLSESYFVNPPQDSHLYALMSNETRETSYQIKDNECTTILQMWDTLREPDSQFGFSKSTNTFYAKLCVTHFHGRGRFTTLPFFLTCHEGVVQEVDDPSHQAQWQQFDLETNTYRFKDNLLHMTYHHMLADGRMLEFVFDQNHRLENHHPTEIYHFIKIYRMAEQLDCDLPCTNHTPVKRMKL